MEEIKIQDHLCPDEAEIGAELGNIPTYKGKHYLSVVYGISRWIGDSQVLQYLLSEDLKVMKQKFYSCQSLTQAIGN